MLRNYNEKTNVTFRKSTSSEIRIYDVSGLPEDIYITTLWTPLGSLSLSLAMFNVAGDTGPALFIGPPKVIGV